MQLTRTLLLAASIPLVCTSLSGNDTSDHFKTYLSPREAIRHLPHEYSIYHDHVYTKRKNKSIKNHLQATGFYRATTEETSAGKHFGSGRNNNGINIGNPFLATAEPGFVADRARMMRRFDPTDPRTPLFVTDKGGITFKPKQQQIGIRFDYHRDLCGVLDKFFFQMSTPLVHVKNDLNVTICDENPDKECGSLLARFFSGSYEITNDAANLQAPLTKARICGAHSHVGFADIDFHLGYKCFEKCDRHLFLKLKFTVPTGRKPNGDYVFDAIYGNGGHFGLGWQADAAASFECTKHATMKVMAAFMHSYLFEANETRTPSVKGLPFSQYYLAARLGQEEKPFFPAANVLTQKMRIKPGHQIEGLFAGSFKSSNFVIDAGYNLYWRDREGAWVKCWKDDQYALLRTPTRDNDGTIPVPNDGISSENDVKQDDVDIVIDNEDIDTHSVETPELISHTLYASLGYNFHFCKDYPLFAGLGGSYEFGNNHSTFDSYSIWVKLGASF